MKTKDELQGFLDARYHSGAGSSKGWLGAGAIVELIEFALSGFPDPKALVNVLDKCSLCDSLEAERDTAEQELTEVREAYQELLARHVDLKKAMRVLAE